jgi:NAD(P)-dependent dehydrogenase (short-subunit alcohol dehydrogenase family)
MSPPVAFVIGAGPGVGLTVARHLAAQGYKLAIGSRNPDSEGAKKEGFFPVKLDIAKHETISKGFTDLEAHYGTPASVVVYNGAYLCAASLRPLTRRLSPQRLRTRPRRRTPTRSGCHSTRSRALPTVASACTPRCRARSRASVRSRTTRVCSS